MAIFSTEEVIERMLKIYSTKTMKELGDVLNLGRGAVSNWNVRQSIPLDILLRVSQEKSVSVDWLLFGKEEQRKLDPLEELLLSSFNELDNKAKMSILSLIHNGGSSAAGTNQTAGNHSVNNIFSGDNLTINKK